ncbi:alpha/beta fold hydrolase [Hymenobacter crusticola]|uniref:alpha/beta fold hydrolase n=1 Tax=Hymenobacter crusticola TaxID=1770526 RepID=UPI000A387E8C|nr:alpha/beta fold hydrolase [Hymenobacter crusticola]
MFFTKSNFPLRHLTWLLWLTLLVAPALSCTKDAAQPTEEPTVTTPTPAAPQTGQLLSSTLIGEYTPADLAGRVSDVPLVGTLTKYSIKAYRLTYTTLNTDGKTITASGALLVPVTPQPLAVLSYQHGTIRPADEDRAPSHYNSNSEVWSAVSVLASTGYIVSAPDYIGYGASKAYPHPYEHAASLASASADMLRAAYAFCGKENVQVSKKNFLLGYSEGGFATLALHKLLEEKYANEFAVTACAPGAGAYHKSAFADYILGSDKPLSFLSTYVWVLDTYNRVYGINRPLSYYFKAPYAEQLKANVFGDVPDYPSQLFTDAFRTSILQKTDAQMLAAFRDNDIYDWKPTAPLALFHGTADDYVPYFNSQDAYNAMQARGAKQVQLRPIQGGNHFTSVATYTLAAYAFISQYNTELK